MQADPSPDEARDAEIRGADEQLEVLVGQLCHDLRNPLTSVSMSLQMLQEQPSVTEDDEVLWMVDRRSAARSG